MNERRSHSCACPTYVDRLVDLSDGELSADERAAVEAHVTNCGQCREQLRRLNASLAALRHSIGDVAPVERRRHPPRRFTHTAVWIAVGSTAAAILLTVGIASLPKVPTGDSGEPVVVKTPTIGRPESPQAATTSVSTEDALRHIALLEQQARLETSLALMPNDPWFAEQRATNEHLLSTFREAAATQRPTSTTNPRSNKTL